MRPRCQTRTLNGYHFRHDIQTKQRQHKTLNLQSNSCQIFMRILKNIQQDDTTAWGISIHGCMQLGLKFDLSGDYFNNFSESFYNLQAIQSAIRIKKWIWQIIIIYFLILSFLFSKQYSLIFTKWTSYLGMEESTTEGQYITITCIS